MSNSADHRGSAAGSGGAGVVLLVDDEGAVRAIASRVLSRAGHEVVVAADGTEAIAAFTADPARFRAVVLDCSMPGLSGWQVAAALRRLRADVPILMTSGRDAGDARERQGVAIDAFLGKPFGPQELADAVAALVRGPRAADAADRAGADQAGADQAGTDQASSGRTTRP